MVHKSTRYILYTLSKRHLVIQRSYKQPIEHVRTAHIIVYCNNFCNIDVKTFKFCIKQQNSDDASRSVKFETAHPHACCIVPRIFRRWDFTIMRIKSTITGINRGTSWGPRCERLLVGRPEEWRYTMADTVAVLATRMADSVVLLRGSSSPRGAYSVSLERCIEYDSPLNRSPVQ